MIRRFVRLMVFLLLPLLLLLAAAPPGAAQGDRPTVAAEAAAAPAPGPVVRLAVGDVLQVVLPGEDSFANTVQVDREGRIELPEVGPIAVAGLTLREAREQVRGVLAQRFRDLSRFNLVLRERKLLITVGGYVKTPGPFELPRGANVQQAITVAGGLQPGAQLDRMQVRRDGKAITFDYKRYLDTGDSSLLPVLRTLDEIFVPVSPLTGNVEVPFDAASLNRQGDAGADTPSIRVFGEVNSAGTFAWKEGMTAMDALMRAGGVSRFAGTEQIRIIAGAEPKVFNLKTFLDTGDARLNPLIRGGSTIFVPVMSEEVKSGPRVVYMMGEVQRAGAYEVRAGTGFFDILANAGGPTRFAETRQVRIIRADGKTIDFFDLGGFVERGGGRPPEIRPGDAVFIPEKTQGEQTAAWLRVPTSRAVRVLGAVRSPGRFEWSDEMSLLDLLAQAGGPNDRADTASVQILPGDRAAPIRFDLQKFLDQGGRFTALPVIRGGYTITIPEQLSAPNDTRGTWLRQEAERSIYVMGSVGSPGRYAFDAKLSFLDILSAANGPTTAADLQNIRITHRGEARDRVSRINLATYFETGDDTLMPRIRPGDVIYVPDRNRNWLETPANNVVRVLGSVGKPGRYPITEGMTILDLLAEAGGTTGTALDTRIVVVNLSCCANEARTFDLQKFARTGDFAMLPVVRQGDTVYVPSTAQSEWRIFFEGFRDVVSVLSVIALLKVL